MCDSRKRTSQLQGIGDILALGTTCGRLARRVAPSELDPACPCPEEYTRHPSRPAGDIEPRPRLKLPQVPDYFCNDIVVIDVAPGE